MVDAETVKYVRGEGTLSLVLGLDLAHIGPVLVDTFSKKHGYIAVLDCPLKGGLLASGNRTWPLTKKNIDKAITEYTSSF